jgi:hypothetical protein
LATDEAIFPAGVGPECQATIGPELPLGTETVRVCMIARIRAARIGPIEGICRSSFVAGCFRLSAKSSRRTPWRKAAKVSNCT